MIHTIFRRTWGFQKRFADVEIRTVFLLGSHPKSSDKGNIFTIFATLYL